MVVGHLPFPGLPHLQDLLEEFLLLWLVGLKRGVCGRGQSCWHLVACPGGMACQLCRPNLPNQIAELLHLQGGLVPLEEACGSLVGLWKTVGKDAGGSQLPFPDAIEQGIGRYLLAHLMSLKALDVQTRVIEAALHLFFQSPPSSGLVRLVPCSSAPLAVSPVASDAC